MRTRRYVIRTPEDIGRTIAEGRLARGLTQEQLAELTGADRTYLARIEAGHAVQYMERVLALLRAVGIELTGTQEIHDG